MSENKPISASEKMKGPLRGEPGEQRTHPVLVMLAGFLSAFVLIGCCLCGGGLYWFRPEIREDAVQAERLLREIVEIRIPESFQPFGTIEWNVAYALRLRGVYFERFVGDGVIALVEANSRFGNHEDVRRHIRQTMLKKGGGGTPLVINDNDTTVRMFKIRGKDVPFLFEIGHDPAQPNSKFHLVEGVFDGKHGQVMLSVRVDAGHWDEPSIIAMIESIGRPTDAIGGDSSQMPGGSERSGEAVDGGQANP